MADEEIVSAIDKVTSEVSGLSKTTEKLAESQIVEAKASAESRDKQIETLKLDIETGEKNSKQNIAVRKELVQLQKEKRGETLAAGFAAMKIAEEKSLAIQKAAADHAKSAAALGISPEELKLQQDIHSESMKKGAAESKAETDAIKELKSELSVLEEGIKSTGGSLEKNEEYQRRSAEIQAAELELAQRGLSGIDLQKDQLKRMGDQLTKGTSLATDNKKYNKLDYKIKLQEIKDRLANATSPAAKKEILAEQAALQKKQGGLLGKIAGGIFDLKQQGLDKLKSVGKGAMALLKGTLIAGMLLALVAFLDSDMWKKMKETLIGAIEKLGKVWDAFGEKGFIGGIKELFCSFGGWTIAIGALVATIVGVFAVKKLLAPLSTAFGLVKGLFGGIAGKLTKLIPGKGGADAAAKMAGKAPGKATKGNAGKAFGQVIGNIGKGLGRGIEGILRGLAMGLSAFKNPTVLLGAAILAGSIVVIGAGIAGATWLLGAALPKFAEGMKSFENLDGVKLLSVAKGIGAIGLAMVAQAAGGIAKGASSLIGGALGALGSLFGDGKKQSPLDQLKLFSETKINTKQAIANANALTAYGKAMAMAGAGEGLGGVGAILSSLGTFFAGKEAKTPLQKLVEFGNTLVNSVQVDKNAKALGVYSKAMGEALKSAPAAGFGEALGGILGSIGSFFGAKAEPGPLDKLKTFGETEINSEQVAKNANSLAIYSKGMADAAKASPKGGIGDLMKGMLGSLAGWLGKKSPLEKMKLFSDMKINHKGVKDNVATFKEYLGMFSGQDTASKGIDALTESISKLLDKLTDSDVDTAVKNMARLGQGLSYGRTRAVRREIKKMNDNDLAIPVAIKGQVQVMKDAKLDEAGAKARGYVNIVNSYNNTTDASRKTTGVQNFGQPLKNTVAVEH
tara:strand:- start:11 stop:2734 length:2724 start_codon:yes stop_codon:yes gene_type:complete